MKLSTTLTALSLTLLLAMPVSGNNNRSLPEQVLNQELLLNQLMTSIHILQLDFLDRNVRDEMQEQLIQLDANFQSWTEQNTDKESSELLVTVKSLWPVISKHIQWLTQLPEQSRPPQAESLMRALGKLDRQLMLLRQKHLNSSPAASQKYRFLEQALLMQRMTREYLSLTLSEQQLEDNLSRKKQFQDQVSYFHQRLTGIEEDLSSHPHASQPLKQSVYAWQYIAKTFQGFPDNPVPLAVIRYNNRIVSKLASIQRMF